MHTVLFYGYNKPEEPSGNGGLFSFSNVILLSWFTIDDDGMVHYNDNALNKRMNLYSKTRHHRSLRSMRRCSIHKLISLWLNQSRHHRPLN